MMQKYEKLGKKGKNDVMTSIVYYEKNTYIIIIIIIITIVIIIIKSVDIIK